VAAAVAGMVVATGAAVVAGAAVAAGGAVVDAAPLHPARMDSTSSIAIDMEMILCFMVFSLPG
jgi:hypothetical protein